ncbi:MAG: non-hydrolyzing UDP-N-acetylglucosamine 2-epimerase [Gammaproteobacteria bacterium]
MYILTIVGARPQFIKAAVVSRAIEARNNSTENFIREEIVHTGQHYDENMSAVFFKQLSLKEPAYNLEISNLDHGAMTGRMIEKLESLYIDKKPDAVVVYGDTNSTLAAAIAASKMHIPIVHIEAGLRSRNLSMPEEVNRILTDRVSNYLYCPSETAVSNLTKEGFPYNATNGHRQSIDFVGDVMYDAVLYYKKHTEDMPLPVDVDIDEKYILCTIHRAENTDDIDKLMSIVEALVVLSKNHRIILPLHPRTKVKLGNTNLLKNILVVDPLPYLELQKLMQTSEIIITDSGGMQKEALFHDVPCITIREETEWVETIECGMNILVGSDKEKLIAAVDYFLMDQNRDSTTDKSMYGEGNASELIVSNLIAALT